MILYLLQKLSFSQKRLEYPNLIAIACRFGISRRAMCALSNALLFDMEILTLKTTRNPNKIQRMFHSYEKNFAQSNPNAISGVECIMLIQLLLREERSFKSIL